MLPVLSVYRCAPVSLYLPVRYLCCLSIYLYATCAVCLSTCTLPVLSVYLPVCYLCCLSIYLYVTCAVCLSTCTLPVLSDYLPVCYLCCLSTGVRRSSLSSTWSHPSIHLYQYICLSIYLYVTCAVCVSTCMLPVLSVYRCALVSLYLPVRYLSVCLQVCAIHPSIHPSISVYLSVSLYLPVRYLCCLSIYLYITCAVCLQVCTGRACCRHGAIHPSIYISISVYLPVRYLCCLSIYLYVTCTLPVCLSTGVRRSSLSSTWSRDSALSHRRLKPIAALSIENMSVEPRVPALRSPGLLSTASMWNTSDLTLTPSKNHHDFETLSW